MTSMKCLDELELKELKVELERRRLKRFEKNKDILTARLRHARADEGEDPETYLFEVDPDIGELLKIMKDSLKDMYDSMGEEMKMMGNKVDEIVLKKEGQLDQIDKMMSHAKRGIDSLMKEQLPVDSLVKEQLPGQDLSCTNNSEGCAGDCSAVCDCVVGKSCGYDFKEEKCDNDCCDDLNGMYQIQRKETNEEARDVCYVPEDFVPNVSVTSTSMCRTDQSNIGSASKLAAVDFKDLCLSVSTFDENSNHESLITVSDSLPWMSSGEIMNTGPNKGQGRNNEFDFACGIRENSRLGNCFQAIDKNCICGAHAKRPSNKI